MDSQLRLIEESFNARYSFWVRDMLDELPESFTVTDPHMSGHPIVFASRGFLKMYGYSSEEIIGKNGRMFQGPQTSRRSVMKIREAIREERTIEISMWNYRKDGSPFWMLFHMCPVFSKEDGRVINFVGVQVPISRKQRRSGSGFRRNVVGSCRMEACLESMIKLDSDDRELQVDEHCESSDLEKRKADTAINNVLSMLSYYSHLTGQSVCEKRWCLSSMGVLGSSLNISLGRIKQSFVLTDPQLPDMPIVFASDAFLKLTGYARHEVVGRNCRFLSGVDTNLSTIFQIRESIQKEQPCTVHILNYRKDKSSFWNLLHISPVRNGSGKIAYYVGVQIDNSCKNWDRHGLRVERKHCSVVGAVKVAVRSLSMCALTVEP